MTEMSGGSRAEARPIWVRAVASLIVCSLTYSQGPAAAWAQTRTQTYQPGEPRTGLPGGAPGRGNGTGPSGAPSVYCQNWPGRSPYPQYNGTGPQTPCGPNFQQPGQTTQQAPTAPQSGAGDPAANQPQACCPFDVRASVPGAAPPLNFTLGFERGVNDCLESGATNPFTLCLIAVAVVGAKFKNAAALAGVVVTGRVMALGALMQDLQRDINSSPDPYQTGIGYGRRFCIWMGAAMAFAPGASAGGGRGRTGGNTGGNPSAGQVGAGNESGPGSGGASANQSCSSTPQPGQSNLPVLNGGALDLALADSWLPQFNETGCNANCGYVAAAVDNALGGRGVSPAPPVAAMNTDPSSNGYVPLATLQMVFGRNFGNPGTPQLMEAQLARGGPGARGILFVYRPGAQNAGHFFNIADYNNGALLLDGQIGRTRTWQEFGTNALFRFMPTYP